MGALYEFLYWLAWYFRKPMLWMVRFRGIAEDIKARLALDPARPVCYVLPARSWADLFVLDRLCKIHGLPRPHRTGNELPSVEKPGFLYLSALLETRRGAGGVTALVQQAVANPSYDLQLVPVSIFWGRDPGQETSLFKLLFADTPGAGTLRKFLTILANGRNVLPSFAPAIPFREFMNREGDPARGLRKLTRALHFHFLRARTAALGPNLLPRPVVIQGLLASRVVQLAIEQEAKEKNLTLEQATRRARKCAEELTADYAASAIRFIEVVLGQIWSRVFRGIELRGLERVREWAQSHEMLYLPSHRSHADYLLLSYVLNGAGIVPPHIAAGINLNIPFGIGNLLRRCGAFFIRRSFSGDRVYTAVFRAYVDSLIRHGYSISFYPEGSRSRTGRLLSPKTGLMSMVVEAALRQRVRKVAIVPVYIGYDKVWEINSHVKEQRGARKQQESVQGLLKATRILTKSFGKAYINFGEPIALAEFADRALPGWREGFGTDAEPQRPENYPLAVTQLAHETMCRINAAAVANPAGLTAVALLAAPQKAVAEDDLRAQLGHLIGLLQARPYSADQHLPQTDPQAVVDWAAPIAGLSRVQHAWGDLLVADSRAAVSMTYYRNNVQHLFALPSLIANFYRTRYRLPESAVIEGCVALYPFLRTEFFLRWEPNECQEPVRAYVEAMIERKLLRRSEGLLQRPEVDTPEFAVLAMLGRILAETLERYCMTTLLLAQERKQGGDIPRARFEEDCRLLAERLAVLTGRNSPEFFDAGLFRGYINSLIELGLVSERPDKTLQVDAAVERIADRAVQLLGPETLQILLQLLARRPLGPVPAE